MGHTKEQNTAKKLYEKSSIGRAHKIIDNVVKKNRWIIKVYIAISLIISFIVSYKINKIIDMPFEFGIVLFIAAEILQTCLVYKLCAMLYKETEFDEDRNYDASTQGYYGTAEKMTEEEKKKGFISGDYLTLKENIVGAEIDNILKMYAIKADYGINGNMLVIGAPGAGKSRCIAIPYIMQTIRRGESMIITDPKGELYGKTAEMARAHGYTVKILNLNPRQMVHSDSCNYMSVIGKDDLKAMSFASTIVANTSNGKDGEDFWAKSELNLLTSAILYVANNNVGIEKNLGGVYKLLSTHSVESLENIFMQLPDSHPAKGPFNIYANGDKTVKGNTLAGLCIRMQVFNNPLVRKITGTEGIDFILPGKEKCLYFIGSSDQDSSMDFLVALFFVLLYQELVNYADSLPERKLPIKVTMLLDEFKNIGVIPDFDKKLSTVRSRGIDSIMILQDLGQLQTMYPENTWETIINDCSTYILLRTNSMLTAKYFSDRSGIQTVEDKGRRYIEKTGDLVGLHGEYQITSSHNQRPVFTADEVLTLNPDHILVVLSSYHVAELQKIDYSNHPMNKEIREVVTSKHTPDWIYDIKKNEYSKYGITEDEEFCPEGTEVIELCDDEDFSHPYEEKSENDNNQEVEEFEAYETNEDEEVDTGELEI